MEKAKDTRELADIMFEFDNWREGHDELDENADVIFKLSDGSTYCGTLFTYQNLLTLAKRNRVSGECLFGKYFYCDKPVFIEKMEKQTIISVIKDIIERGEVDLAFTRIDGKE